MRFEKIEEKEEDVLSNLLFRFTPYWPLFLILFLISSVGAWIYLRYTPPMYTATAKILIKDEKKGVDNSKMLESLDIYTSKKIVENEMEVISSRGLMREVVKKSHLYAPTYEKGRFKDINAYHSSPIIIEAREPDNLTTKQKIFYIYNKDKGIIEIGNQSYSLNIWHNTPYGDLKFSLNKNVTNNPVKPLYFSLYKPSDIARRMVGRLSVKPTNKVATVLQLRYSDETPKRAEDILNELINNYAQGTVDEKNILAANTLSFIEDRLKFVVRDLDSIERSIQQYKSQKGIVNLSEQGKVFLQNVSDNDRQASSISMQLAVLDQVEKYVISKNNKAGIVPSTLGLNDAVLSQLLQQLYDQELQYGKLKQTMAENSPMLISISNEIERIRPTILENIRNQKTNLQAGRNNLTATSGQYASMLRSIPEKERELLEISRQQAIKNSVYSFLLQKREETALSASSTVADSRLIDVAEASYSPSSPNKIIVYLIGLIVSLLIGVAIVIWKELLTGKILFRSDVEKYTKVPIVAEIASVKHKNELVISLADRSYVSEQFRHLRASIGLYGKNASRKKILITSSIAGEGKSFVAANLALSLALSGKKVVLVDADLRSPKTSCIFNLVEEKGFAEYLKGELDMMKLVKESDHNNLSVIPAGGSCVNPTELLLNGNLSALFTYLGSVFDYVLVDTSPIDPVTDAYVLSEYCDRTLIVIRHAYTPKAMVRLLDDNNKVKVFNSLAIVFNGVKKRGFFKGSFGFGYGFGYEYVYKERKNLRPKSIKSSMN